MVDVRIGGDRPSIAESYTPARLKNPRYYTDVINERLRKAGFRPDWIDPSRNPQINDEVTGGIYDNSLLRVITTFNKKGYALYDFFAKIMHPDKRATSDTLDQRDLERRAIYEFEHLHAWNAMGLPSPRVIDMFSEDAGGNGNLSKVYTILMEYIGTPAHDIDIIAINSKIEEFRKRLGDPFYSQEHKEILRKAIGTLNESRKDILRSILKTQVETELCGAYYVNLGEGRDRLKTHQYEASDQLKSAVHCAKEFKKWNQIIRGAADPRIRGLEQVVSLPFGIECNMSLNSLVTFLFNGKNERYVQGDEFLHHYLYDTREDGRKVSVMIDANLTQLGDPMYGVMKTLTSPLLIEIPYEELVGLIEFRNEFFIRRMTELSKSLKGMESIVKNEDVKNSLLRGDLFALFLIPKLMGLKARDENRNKPHFERLYGLVKPYGNSMVEFPHNEKPENVSFSYYNSKESIEALSKRLNEVLQHIRLRHRLNGKLETMIKSAEDFYKGNNYL